MELIEAVAQVGFPIVVSLYLLTKFRDTLDKLTEAIHGLKSVVRECPKKKVVA